MLQGAVSRFRQMSAIAERSDESGHNSHTSRVPDACRPVQNCSQARNQPRQFKTFNGRVHFVPQTDTENFKKFLKKMADQKTCV